MLRFCGSSISSAFTLGGPDVQAYRILLGSFLLPGPTDLLGYKRNYTDIYYKSLPVDDTVQGFGIICLLLAILPKPVYEISKRRKRP